MRPLSTPTGPLASFSGGAAAASGPQAQAARCAREAGGGERGEPHIIDGDFRDLDAVDALQGDRLAPNGVCQRLSRIGERVGLGVPCDE